MGNFKCSYKARQEQIKIFEKFKNWQEIKGKY